MTDTAAITKRTHRLSDGRELIYFDDADTTLSPQRAVDARQPQPRPPVATMRQDPLTGEWIAIAAARQNRILLPPAERDPLAPTTTHNPTEIPSNYDVAVFENKSPSFGPALPGGPNTDTDTDTDTGAGALEQLQTVGLGRSRPAYGRCEVVCFAPEHSGSFATLSPSRARTVVTTQLVLAV